MHSYSPHHHILAILLGLLVQLQSEDLEQYHTLLSAAVPSTRACRHDENMRNTSIIAVAKHSIFQFHGRAVYKVKGADCTDSTTHDEHT